MKLRVYKHRHGGPRDVFLACNIQCAEGFKEDRRYGLNYGLFRYADGTFARDREEASVKCRFCAYCGHSEEQSCKAT